MKPQITYKTDSIILIKNPGYNKRDHLLYPGLYSYSLFNEPAGNDLSVLYNR